MSYPYSPEQEEESLERICLDSGPLDTSSGTITVRESSPNGSGTDSCPKHPSSAMSGHSPVTGSPQAIRAWLMSLQPGSHVSPSQLQENSEEQTTNATCGPQQPTLFGLSGHDESCLKMCREYASTCPSSSETCGDLATVYEDPCNLGLTTAEGRTGENESGYWLTPTASESIQDVEKFKKRMEKYPNETTMPNLATQVRQMWPTPRAGKTTNEEPETWLKRQAEGKVSTPPLTLAVKMWPTPIVGDAHLSSNPEAAKRRIEEGKVTLSRVVQQWPTPDVRGFSNDGALQMLKDVPEREGMAFRAGKAKKEKQWPTPAARDWRGHNSVETMTAKLKDGQRAQQDQLPNAVAMEGSLEGQLNPDWVEALMSWPVGWTSLEPLSREAFDHWQSNPKWQDWEPDIPRVGKSIKNRASRLKAIGNGQVPIVVATAWRLLTQNHKEAI